MNYRDIHTLRKKLENGDLRAIAERTGEHYELVYRTMNASVRKLTDKHFAIFAEARNIINQRG